MPTPSTASDLSHLTAEAREAVLSGDEARFLYLKSQHWLGYERAIELLNFFDEMMHRPKKLRMPCSLLVAETNNGKTTLLNRVFQKHPPGDGNSEFSRHIPILMIQSPPVADERRLYGAIIDALHIPAPSKCSADLAQRMISDVLHGVGTQLIIIDEFQHLITGSTNQHRYCLQAVKWMTNQLQIPIVGAGVKVAYSALRSDPQLENRFELMTLPRWEDGERLGWMLANIEKILPLKKPSGLPLFTSQIAKLIDGKLGELMNLMEVASIHAIKSGTERIDLKVIRDCGWTPPLLRTELLRSLQ